MEIIKAHEPIRATTIRVLIYGEPGIGKTTLGLTAPRPLLVDCDSGVRRVAPQFRSDYVPVTSWKDILDVTEDQLPDYETLVIDTVGKAMEFLADQVKKENYKLTSKTGGLTLQGWGALLAQFTDFLGKVQRRGKHIVFVAHHREGQEDEKRYFRPDISGRSLGNIVRDMDLVGYMQSRNNERTISFNPTDAFYGKNTCSLPPVINIPDLSQSASKPLSNIFGQYETMLESQAEVMKSYEELLSDIDIQVGSIEDPDTADSFFTWFQDIVEIWDSHSIARLKVGERLKDLKIKFDKTSGRAVWINPPVAKESVPSQDKKDTNV